MLEPVRMLARVRACVCMLARHLRSSPLGVPERTWPVHGRTAHASQTVFADKTHGHVQDHHHHLVLAAAHVRRRRSRQPAAAAAPAAVQPGCALIGAHERFRVLLSTPGGELAIVQICTRATAGKEGTRDKARSSCAAIAAAAAAAAPAPAAAPPRACPSASP